MNLHHHLQMSALQAHVTHDDCLEVLVLRGPVGQLRQMADAILTQKGVRMGQLHIMPLPAGERADGPLRNPSPCLRSRRFFR